MCVLAMIALTISGSLCVIFLVKPVFVVVYISVAMSREILRQAIITNGDDDLVYISLSHTIMQIKAV